MPIQRGRCAVNFVAGCSCAWSHCDHSFGPRLVHRCGYAPHVLVSMQPQPHAPARRSAVARTQTPQRILPTLRTFQEHLRRSFSQRCVAKHMWGGTGCVIGGLALVELREQRVRGHKVAHQLKRLVFIGAEPTAGLALGGLQVPVMDKLDAVAAHCAVQPG